VIDDDNGPSTGAGIVPITSEEGKALKKTLEHLQAELNRQKTDIEVLRRKVEDTESRIIAAIGNALKSTIPPAGD
jgi:hypothetical protein